MPINPKLKAQLEADKTMTDEYRTSLIATLEDAPPSVQNYWMSQDDYTRKTNEYKKQMDKFYADSTVAVEAYKTEAQKAQEASAAAAARIAELEAAGTSAVPKVPGQDEAIAKELSGLKTLITDLDSKFGAVVTKEQLEQVYQQAVGFIGEQILDLNEISAQHQERFGKRFTKTEQGELVTFANQKATELKHPVSLDEAYKMKFGTELDKLKEQEIERRVEEKLKTAHTIPGGLDGAAGGSPVERGPAQIRIEQETNRRAGITDASKAGYATWQEAAAAGANELVAEGKH